MQKKYPHIVVSVFVEDKEGKIALFKSPQWPGLWIPPGGHIEYCEKMKDTAKREAKEELGVIIYNLRLVNVIEIINSKVNKNLSHLISVHFLYKMRNRNFILDKKEIVDYKWFNLSDAINLKNITSSTRETLRKIKEYEKNLCSNS